MKKFKKYLVEILKQEDDSSLPKIDDADHLKHIPGEYDKEGINKIHHHPDIIPRNLSVPHMVAINHYTSNAGSNVHNPFLDRLANNKLTDDDKNDANQHLNQIKKIHEAFTSENTNRKPIITYSGIPTDIGRNFLKANPNSKHTLTRFTSTTTSPNVGMKFAHYSNHNKTNEIHVLKIHNQPGSALSVASISDIPNENEMMLNHGTHITYHHTTKVNKEKNGKDYTLYTHHITAHNTKTPIEQYSGHKNLTT